MTDTADLADYVLPATTQLEHLDVHTSYGHTYALINEPAIAPLGEARPNTEIFRALAARMGFDEPCFADERRGAGADRLQAGGAQAASISPTLRAHGWVKLDIAEAPFAEGGFPTPSGKCRIDAPGLGVPDYVAELRIGARARPSSRRRFPLAMISPPARNFLNSSFVNVASLRGIEGEPVLEIDPRRRRGARHRLRAAGARSSTTAASIDCKARRRRRARGRAWSTAWASGGGSSRPTAATATS